MRTRQIAAGLCVLMVSAADPASPEDLIRQGVRAVKAGDFDGAADLFAEAQPMTDDPGLAAFNRGIALYRQERFREAEANFRRSLDDRAAPKQRRTRALYNLGNCLLAVAGPDDLDRFRSAVACYQNALDGDPADPAFRGDIAHNLQLAKLLWVGARARATDPPPPSEEPSDTPEPTPPEREDGGRNRPPEFDPTARPFGDPNAGGAQPVEGQTPDGDQGRPTTRTVPGEGELPVLPDSEELLPLTPEQAANHLRVTFERLAGERKSRSRTAETDRPGVRNW